MIVKTGCGIDGLICGTTIHYPPTYDPGEDECDEEVEVRHAAELLHQVQGQEGVQAVLGRLEPKHNPVSMQIFSQYLDIQSIFRY